MSVGLARHGRCCPECGRNWTATRSDARYCSGKCRMRAMRKAEGVEQIRELKEKADREAAELVRQRVAAEDVRQKAAAAVAKLGLCKKCPKPKKPQASRKAATATKPKSKAKGRAK